MVRNENVDHPAHYQGNGMEVMDILDAFGFGRDFCVGNIVKYVLRAGRKNTNTTEDLEKAKWYLNHLIGLGKKETIMFRTSIKPEEYGTKELDEKLFNADIDDLIKVHDELLRVANVVATMVNCVPLDKDIERFREFGFDIMDAVNKVMALSVAYEAKWKLGDDFEETYNRSYAKSRNREMMFNEIVHIVRTELNAKNKIAKESEVNNESENS